MTNLHGPDCVKILREKFNYKGLVLGVTANVMTADIEYFIAAGADAVLDKPISTTLLFEKLKQRRLTSLQALSLKVI